MRLLFIRHGEPDYKNDSLTPKGFKEADLLAERLSRLTVRDYYCSPLGRALATAKPTLDLVGREAEVLDWLREFPGHIIDEETGKKRIPWDLLPGFWTKRSLLYGKDEWLSDEIMTTGNTKEVYTNIASNMDQLLLRYGYRRDGNMYRCEEGNTDTIVFFCHLGVQFAILSHLLGISAPALWQGFYVAPTSVTMLVTEERVKGEAAFRCRCLGDTSHLYARKEPLSTAGFFDEVFGGPVWPDEGSYEKI